MICQWIKTWVIWIVPYGGRAQFQLGYKGYIQLALRTGQYKFINCIPVHEGELQKWNPLTEEIEIDFENGNQMRLLVTLLTLSF